MKKIICIVLALLLLSSCRSYETTSNAFDSSKDIVILYTNVNTDDQEHFYAKVKETKELLLKETPNVTLIDTGNNTNVELMNNAKYDYACFGLNDFSNGLDAIYDLTNKANYKYLLCATSYNGQTKDIFKKTTPYEVVDYDGIKIGYIGVFSARYAETNPDYFKEDDKTVINFYNETEEVFYDTVECSIEKAKDKGADYIVLLTNFDDDEKYSPYTLEELIANLSYVDIVINGNVYSKSKEITIKNKDNEDVLIISNGQDGIKIGQVIISKDSIVNKETN